MDYVKKESRGKAAAFQNLGNLLGETFAMLVLFGISKETGMNTAFCIAAIVTGSLSFLTLCFVRNPTIKDT